MWTQPVLISICLLLLGAASAKQPADYDDIVKELEKLLLNSDPNINPSIEKLRKCDHESGEEARCVKKSLCKLAAPALDRSTQFEYRELIEGGCTYLQTCCPESQINLTNPSPPLNIQNVGCGYSNPGANVLRELASDNGYADFGEFPWSVALMKKNVPDAKFHDAYIGGGTLIDASVVLTVAHKIDEISASNLKVRAGEWDTKTIEEAYPHQERNVKKIIIHEEYIRLRAHYDFALVILEKPFDLNNSPHIGIACLDRSLPPPGTQCYSMGWGEDFKTATHKYAEILKKVPLPLVDGNKCQNKYRNSKLGRTYNLHKTLTCAGGEPDVDTCLGDGGSSLVCPVPDKVGVRYSMVGMVVYGLGCGTDLPGVYAKVPEVYDWVQTKMVEEGFTTSSFKRD
ncbi:phenoloxidase-activating factor 2-like [Melitaea cinxia]|uniref:phenoloxidase-activating factor 2-like n=1 Tax=Melitaea cinxia TaxID=113334 RepID=UPI001E273305|nr:phenoloxidase-activating factor 2-like [Melitaea cinxia]